MKGDLRFVYKYLHPLQIFPIGCSRWGSVVIVKSESAGLVPRRSRGPADLFWGRHPGSLYHGPVLAGRGGE